jgi:serine/threonine-protein kinase
MTATAELKRSAVELVEPVATGDLLLARYRVVRRVAAGGHSVVYLGEDERLNRPVCIKIFHKLFDHQGIFRTTYEHFVQEAFALSRLSHPNTLRIYDFGHVAHPQMPDHQAPFQVSEYMSGGTLSRVIRRQGPFGLGELLRVTTALCGALTEAHRCGIIHRDLKPKNILFGDIGGGSRIPKLADFGIAKTVPLQGAAPLSHRAGDTRIVAGQSMVMCSPSWAAPELLLGAEAHPSTDLYSLALIVLYMYSGKVLFQATDPTRGIGERNASAERIAQWARQSSITGPLLGFLTRAIRFDRAQRPQTADEFLSELVQHLAPPAAATASVRRAEAPPAVADGDHAPAAPHQQANAALPPPTAPRRATPAPPALTASTMAYGAKPTSGIASPVPPTGAATAAPPTGAATAAPPSGAGERAVVLRAPHQQVAERSVELLPLGGDGTSLDVAAPNEIARLRVTAIPSGHGSFGLHVKGLDCFVELDGGRPSAAVSIDRSRAITLHSPSRRTLGRLQVLVGERSGANAWVTLDGTALVLPGALQGPLFALDFGAGSRCLLLCEPATVARLDRQHEPRRRAGQRGAGSGRPRDPRRGDG